MPIFWLINTLHLVARGPYLDYESAEDERVMQHSPDDWRIVQEVERS